jgi:hypothetical protein
MSVDSKNAKDESTLWIPVCCSQVMRHSVFGSAEGKSVAAALRCTSCGRHILLQPQTLASVEDYGTGSRVIALLATPRAHKIVGEIAAADGDMGEETLA